MRSQSGPQKPLRLNALTKPLAGFDHRQPVGRSGPPLCSHRFRRTRRCSQPLAGLTASLGRPIPLQQTPFLDARFPAQGG